MLVSYLNLTQCKSYRKKNIFSILAPNQITNKLATIYRTITLYGQLVYHYGSGGVHQSFGHFWPIWSQPKWPLVADFWFFFNEISVNIWNAYYGQNWSSIEKLFWFLYLSLLLPFCGHNQTLAAPWPCPELYPKLSCFLVTRWVMDTPKYHR